MASLQPERLRRAPKLGPAVLAAALGAAVVLASCGGDDGSNAGLAAAVEPAPPPANHEWVEGIGGFWIRAPAAELSDEQRRSLEELGAIGYVGAYEPAPDASGVTIHDPERAQAGVNLVVSGHAPEAVLLDMDGRVLHRWEQPYERLPNAIENPDPLLSTAWRRAQLLPDGSLLALFEGLALIKLDRDSRLVWSYDGNPHHDFQVFGDDRIVVLTRHAVFKKHLHPTRPIVEDLITVLSKDGREIGGSLSLIECFERSEWSSWVDERPIRHGDIFHTNTIEILDGRLEARDPAFRSGNLLVSMRELHAIAVVDPQESRVVWAARGEWRGQHEPTVVDGGRILLFDNWGYGGYSQLLELDPATLEVGWTYRGDPPSSFYSRYCGSNQRLPNGNTLISETCAGRALEVTRGGEIVWEYVNPERGGENGELIAALLEVLRYPREAVASWLGG